MLEPVHLEAPAAAPPAFEFTGSGAEYFRIWIVNLLLTVATFGIYSAWAKTRRLQYFYRNTQLAGNGFDFIGNPKAILRGRVVALLLLGAWQYGFRLSPKAGIATVVMLLAALPLMMRAALRFRLSNTLYRGLPFGFDGGVRAAYFAYLPPVVMLLVPGALLAMLPGNAYAKAAGAIYLFWPLMHGAMKRYQHSNLRYGNQKADFYEDVWTLASPYAGFVFAALGLTFAFGVFMETKIHYKPVDTLVVFAIAAGLAYGLLVLASPYIMVRMNNLAWSGTSFTGIAIASRMRARAYFLLQLKNVVLTLLTLGLYRPFAVVRVWHYRLAHLHIDAPDGFDQASGRAGRPAASASGDGAADFLGPDLSW
jgi:uncharacterized membrane protein YjgN (DUF898 family)